MYDELIKRLREGAISADSGNEISESLYRDILQAADAIETLETNYDASTDIMKHQTEYIEELERERDSANEAATALYGALPKWIPVTERLPEILHTVIVSGRMKYEWETDFFRFVDVATYTEGEFFETFNDWYEGQDEFEITHWMPLPQPPEEGE